MGLSTIEYKINTVLAKPISTDTLVHTDHSSNNSNQADSKDNENNGIQNTKASPSSSSTVLDDMNNQSVARGGVVTPFPWKLHDMLERVDVDGYEQIVSWQPHGRSFMVHKPDAFVETVMPVYFNQTKFASFQRQLNLYGFRRITQGRDKGAYYHSCFLRGQRNLCQGMNRQKVKGTRVRRAIAPAMEPDFWTQPFLPENTRDGEVTVAGSDDDSDAMAVSSSLPSPISSSSPMPLKPLVIPPNTKSSPVGNIMKPLMPPSMAGATTIKTGTTTTIGTVGTVSNSSINCHKKRRGNHKTSQQAPLSLFRRDSCSDSSSATPTIEPDCYDSDDTHHHQDDGLDYSTTTPNAREGDYLANALLSDDVLFFEGKPFHYLERKTVVEQQHRHRVFSVDIDPLIRFIETDEMFPFLTKD